MPGQCQESSSAIRSPRQPAAFLCHNVSVETMASPQCESAHKTCIETESAAALPPKKAASETIPVRRCSRNSSAPAPTKPLRVRSAPRTAFDIADALAQATQAYTNRAPQQTVSAQNL